VRRRVRFQALKPNSSGLEALGFRGGRIWDKKVHYFTKKVAEMFGGFGDF
jgi:hypothetical protein